MTKKKFFSFNELYMDDVKLNIYQIVHEDCEQVYDEACQQEHDHLKVIAHVEALLHVDDTLVVYHKSYNKE
jgi:hypothetical protein